MKRIICLFLVLTVLSLGLVAPGEETLTDAMSRITLNVKTVLDIPDEYTDFSGNLSDGRWYLYWQGENCSVSVTAMPNGTIMSYNSYSYNDSRDKIINLLNARLPKYSVAELETAARNFADSVIVKNGWNYRLENFVPGLFRGYYSETTVDGYLTYNGVLTDIYFRIEIDNQTCKVTDFYRSDAYLDIVYPEEEISYDSLASAEDMRSALLNAYDMEAVYSVIKAEDMAKLVYVLNNQSIIAADAYTGKLISFDDAGYTAESVEEDVAEAEIAMDAGYGAARKVDLSDVEKSGISLYDGVRSGDELDSLLREMPELNIDDEFILQSADYYLRNKAPVARLAYRKDIGQDLYIYKNITMDAISGRVITLYTYSEEDNNTLRTHEGEVEGEYGLKAAAFLEKYYGDYLDELSLPTATVSQTLLGMTANVSFRFFRAYNGFPFKQNSISVTLDKDGYVTAFNLNWNDGQEFYDIEPDRIISLEAAREAYLGDSSVQLMYRTVSSPEALRGSRSMLVLCYCFAGSDMPYAVDAVSADRYYIASSSRKPYEYDSDGNMLYSDEVVLLGKYGIGLEGNGFTSADKLLGDQFMRLTLQAAGYDNVQNLDDGQLEASFKDLSGISLNCADVITRETLIRIATVLAGYKNVAELSGIFVLDAADWDDIPDDVKGYCAVCRALDLVDLNEGRLDLSLPALTAQAIHAIYIILSM